MAKVNGIGGNSQGSSSQPPSVDLQKRGSEHSMLSVDSLLWDIEEANNDDSSSAPQAPPSSLRDLKGGISHRSSLPPSRFVDLQRRGSVHSVLSVDTFNDSASSHFSSARNDAVFPSVPKVDKQGTTSTCPSTDDDKDDGTGLVERDDRLGLDDYHSYATPDSCTS